LLAESGLHQNHDTNYHIIMKCVDFTRERNNSLHLTPFNKKYKKSLIQFAHEFE